jgi:tetratricopeptide (TPR) repeat protein
MTRLDKIGPESLQFSPQCADKPALINMKRIFWPCVVLLTAVFVFSLTDDPLRAEAGVLVLHVEDVQARPVRGLEIGIEGDGGSGITGDDGKVRIRLARDTKPGSWVTLQILHSPHGTDFVIFSPLERRTLVPPFGNESGNFVPVTVIQRGDLAALQDGTFVGKLVARINNERTSNAAANDPVLLLWQDPNVSVAIVAKHFGLPPDEVERAIQAWTTKKTDSFDVGQAALYRRDYKKASQAFSESARENKEKEADSYNFLGQSLFWQGKYLESATAYQNSLHLRPHDTAVLSLLAMSLKYAGDYTDAELLLRELLAFQQANLQANNPLLGDSKANLAMLLTDIGRYAEAEPLFRDALAIHRKPGARNANVARDLNNFASLLGLTGDYAAAEQAYRTGLDIDEEELGINNPIIAYDLNDLGVVYMDMGDYECAEPLFDQARSIAQDALGPRSPTGGNDSREPRRTL